MLCQTPIMTVYIFFFMILGMKVCSAQKNDRKCLVYEDVIVESPIQFEDIKTVMFDKNLGAITKVKYGEHIQFICDVHLQSSMEIKWKARGKILSSDKNLDIKSVTEKYHGEYITCEVTAHSNVTNVYGTNIKISDLAPPLISDFTPSNVTVTEKDNITLACKIVQGTPPPMVNWQVKRHGDDKFVDLSATGEELTIMESTFMDDGQYRCIAKNMKGKHKKSIDVTIQKSPVLDIKEPLNMTFEYGSSTEFACKISGYPLPKSTWKDREGNTLTSEDTEISWHEKISKLKIKTMKKSNNYTCFAESTLGDAFESVNVTVLSPFLVHEYPGNSTKVHYAESANIICNITSTFPMRIKWFRPKLANTSKQTEILAEKKFEITVGVLKVKSVDLENIGKYTCEASLISDADEKISYTTYLEIDNLAPPKMSDTNKFSAMESTGITLYCHIDGGIPRPTLSWQVMRHGNTTYTELGVSTEDFDIKNITINDAGKYRCVSKNPIGEWTKVTEVQVRKAPVIVIEEGPTVSVAYGGSSTFTCRVVGYPLPTVTWNDAAGLLKTEETIITEHEIMSKVTVDGIKTAKEYYCQATNPVGFSNNSVDVTVLSPFVVHQKPEVETNVHYKASTDLVCNITASFPLRIQWYHNSTKVTSSVVSANQTVLHISSMDLDDIGNYKCEATLISDETQKKEFNTDVKIDDLQPPVITHFNGASVFINKFEELSLVCKAQGNPPPVVTWQHQPPSSSSLNTVGTGESMCSTHGSKEQTGVYKCIATNVAGMDSRDIVVSCPSC